jgi:hypothetical protein
MSDIKCIKAHHEMEERYSRMELDYFTLEQKELIFNTTNDLIKKYKIYPTKIITPRGDFQGEFCLEFHDDYFRESQEFFNELLKKLDIEKCEVD